MAKKKQPAVHVKLAATSSCTLFASFEMRCPLCRVMVPPDTLHQCEVKEQNAQARG